MTTFRTGATAPAWTELTGFEVLDLARDQAITRAPNTPAERLIVSAGTVQFRQDGRSLLLKPAQFLDVDPAAGPWTVVGQTDPAGFVRLSLL